MRAAYTSRVEPKFEAAHGRKIASRNEARKAMLEDPAFQTWSALRRMTMEQRQQAGRFTVIRQREELNEKARELTEGDPRLKLDPSLTIPRYVAAIDHHCMPGGYCTEYVAGDVTNGANYDHAGFVTTSGLLGSYSDGGGKAVVNWVKRNLPDFKPKKILDLGGTVGHSTLPIARAFPDAEVTILDLGAPVLRYGLGRAKSLGVDNVSFVQGTGEDMSMYPDASFDWIQTTMFLHELSSSAMKKIFAETRRLVRPGGVVIHVEQPQYTADMPFFEQAMRDWDAFYNNEPFWSRMHEMDLDQAMIDAGFEKDWLVHGDVYGVVDRDIFPDAQEDETEDYGRKAAWHVIGAVLP
ncbi:methyltransferase domain-containing protein [Novosphingobium sp. MW5]|nr:methyltransferase domain-containing protein [Novosphingobium sp. MW5]